ncbi:MAG: zinc ribbon domain-containing protein [Flavobacteriales bacterium]|nr:zinc ribbon domain-containing protein [Flavobacteriales bacterium]
MRVAAKPGLYRAETDPPILNGTRCQACATVFFPPLGIGCEVCGATADNLTEIGIDAAGVLDSVATVHVYAGDDMQVPFTVGEIRLADGPLIRGLFDSEIDLQEIGAPVHASWKTVGVDENGDEMVEPRFSLTAEGDVK